MHNFPLSSLIKYLQCNHEKLRGFVSTFRSNENVSSIKRLKCLSFQGDSSPCPPPGLHPGPARDLGLIQSVNSWFDTRPIPD